MTRRYHWTPPDMKAWRLPETGLQLPEDCDPRFAIYDKGSENKKPLNPHTGKGVHKILDDDGKEIPWWLAVLQQTTFDYSEALTAAREHFGDAGGVSLYNSSVLVGVDVDGVVAVDGEDVVLNLSGRQADVVDKLLGKTYCELSPSGTGLHFWCTAEGLTFARSTPGLSYYIGGKHIDIEVYPGKDSFGWHGFDSAPTAKPLRLTLCPFLGKSVPVMDMTAEVQSILDTWLRKPEPKPMPAVTPESTDAAQRRADIPDEELINRMLAQNPSAADLWNGSTAAYSGDHSSADMALCSCLAWWCGPDEERIDRLFRQSGLMRQKWEQRKDYRERTIRKAIEGCNGQFYDPGYRSNDRRPQYQEPQAPWPEDADAPVYSYQGHTEAVVNNVQMSLWPQTFTDTGFMRVFQRVYTNRLVYCKLLGWLQWDGCRWVAGDHFGLQAATELAEMMLADAQGERRRATNGLLDAEDDADRGEADGTQQRISDARDQNRNAKQYANFARKCLGARQQKACLELAIPQMTVPALDLDADTNLLNTPSGVVDLRTGETRPNAPEDLCTKITKVAPDPDRGSDGARKWLEFLNLVTDNDNDLRDYMQLVSGMCAIGEVNEETLVFIYGQGSNGKSTTFNSIAYALGDYSKTISVNVITGGGNIQNHLAELRGCRMALGGELEEGQRLSSTALKTLTSKDKVQVMRKFHQPDDIVPTHHTLLYTNVLPKITATDKGTWRRVCVLPFNHTIERKDVKTNFDKQLQAECGGAILQWIIDGAVKFDRLGRKLPDPPKAVEMATANYREREDQVQRFLREVCVYDSDPKTKRKTVTRQLFNEYRRWCDGIGEQQPKTSQQFIADMLQKGYIRRKTGGYEQWIGITIDWNGKLHAEEQARQEREQSSVAEVTSVLPSPLIPFPNQPQENQQVEIEELPY